MHARSSALLSLSLSLPPTLSLSLLPWTARLDASRSAGGNNLYGADLASALRGMSPAERASFILMERIVPSSVPMPMMREGSLDGGPCTCELGVYGVHLSDGQETLLDLPAGHLLRVKLHGVDEGGVCAGFAVLSSPVLYNPELPE